MINYNQGHSTCLILIEVINLSLTRFTDPCALCVWPVSCWVLVDTHQPLVTLAQIVPCSSTALPLHPSADGAAAAHACRHAAFTLELQRPAGGAVDLLAGRAVESLKLRSSSRGRLLWPQRPQQGTQKEENPHHSSTLCWKTPATTFLYTRRPLWITHQQGFTVYSHNLHPLPAANRGGQVGFTQSKYTVNYPHVLSPHYQQCDFVLKWFLLLNTVR